MRNSLLLLPLGALLFACGDEDPTTPDAVACFEFSPSETIYAGQEVSFTSCSENASEFAWDFGDGKLSTEENPTHIYDEGGEFTVTLVAGNETSAGQAEAVITVLPAPLTANRWKYPEVWEDYCEIESQTISGYEYLSFLSNFQVVGESELMGETYGCDDDTWIVGTWEMSEGSYFLIDEDGERFELEIATDGSELCWTEDGERVCYEKE